jgi:hypothetical protein
VTEWAEGLKRLLGKEIVGLYQPGSLPTEFRAPNRNHFDLQAVVRSPLTEGELKFVERLHKEMVFLMARPDWIINHYLMSKLIQFLPFLGAKSSVG